MNPGSARSTTTAVCLEKITEDQLKRTKLESQTHGQKVQRWCGPRQCLTGDLYKNTKAMRIKQPELSQMEISDHQHSLYIYSISTFDSKLAY